MNKKAIAAALLAGGAIVSLAACGSAEKSTPPAPAPVTSEASQPAVGTNPGTWAPIELTGDMNGAIFDAVVGQQGTFVGGVTVTSSDPAVVAVAQEGEGTVAGFTALAPGSATLTATYPDGETATYTISVTAAP